MIAGEEAVVVTVNVSEEVPVPPPLVALKVILEVPATVSVPEIRPVNVFTLRPAGKPEAAKLVGELVAVIW